MKQNSPPMGMVYIPKTLTRQLAEYAAKRVIGAAASSAVRHAERRVFQSRPYQPRPRQFRQSHISKRKTMFTRENTTSSNRTANSQAARRANQQDQEPVEYWQNTVIVIKDGAEPVRIGTGRPLRLLKADKPVNTSNDDMNAANAISNAFINKMFDVAETLDKESGHIFGPKLKKDQKLPAGTYIQIYRAKDDADEDAAVKADRENEAGELLSNLFG